MTRSATTLLCAACAIALALTGCGGDGDGGTSTPSAGTGAAPQLSPARYAAIEDVYEATLPLDGLRDDDTPSSAEKLASLAEPVVVACERLDDDDPLLGDMRKACLASVSLLLATPAVSACSSADSCETAINDTLTATRGMVAASRLGDRAIAAAALPTSCTRALRTPAVAYAYYRRFDARLKALGEALRSRSAAKIRAAAAALARLEEAGVPTARQSLRKFRAGCR